MEIAKRDHVITVQAEEIDQLTKKTEMQRVQNESLMQSLVEKQQESNDRLLAHQTDRAPVSKAATSQHREIRRYILRIVSGDKMLANSRELDSLGSSRNGSQSDA